MKIISLLIISFFFFSLIIGADACKNIVAMGDATGGNYNLLLKVRDPSREGLQVLTIIKKGYEYQYHHPWTGEEMHFVVGHKYIGTVTQGDVSPNITKPGNALVETGIAYADADSPLLWLNPTRHAWDDFDWIRYACERAYSVEEAVDLLTVSVIDDLHAPGVGENLFVVGPEEGYVIEADAFQYNVQEIRDIYVQSNYPKFLWKRSLYPFLFGPTFDTTIKKYVREKGIVRLGHTFFGVKIIDVKSNGIVAKQFPSGEEIDISLGTTETVGAFRVTLHAIEGKKVCISLSYHYVDWESQIMDLLYQRYGWLNVQDMMNLSRLHTSFLDELRGMCEGGFEASTIYKIPLFYPNILSSGWFAPNQCSSVYVPFHVCSKKIYTPYMDGTAHVLAQELLHIYGHGALTPAINDMEHILLTETEKMEHLVINYLDEGQTIQACDLLSTSDLGMQKQAFLWGSIYRDLGEINPGIQREIFDMLSLIWNHNYSTSLTNIKETVSMLIDIQTPFVDTIDTIKEKLLLLAINISECKINQVSVISNSTQFAQTELEQGILLFDTGKYEKGFNHLLAAYHYAENILYGTNPDKDIKTKQPDIDLLVPVFFLIVAVVIFPIVYKKLK